MTMRRGLLLIALLAGTQGALEAAAGLTEADDVTPEEAAQADATRHGMARSRAGGSRRRSPVVGCRYPLAGRLIHPTSTPAA